MTLAEALAARPLTPFEDRDVISAAIEIPNAAGGLREAMKFEPREMHHGDTVYVVMKCNVAKVRFDPIKDTDALMRVHVFHAEEASFIEGTAVESTLAEQREKIQRAKDAVDGIRRLPYGDELQSEHDRGEHEALVEGCPDCESEIEAQKAGD